MYGETHRPYSTSRRAWNTNFILARQSWAERHWVYSGHYPRIFVAPKNAQNAETKHWSGAVPILLLAISASTTGPYSSLGVLQGLNPRHWLLKASVYHSATSAWKDGQLPHSTEMVGILSLQGDMLVLVWLPRSKMQLVCFISSLYVLFVYHFFW